MPGTDGSTLHGTVANGSVILNEAGKVTAIAEVELMVNGGNGNYSGLNSGSGAFGGTLSERPTAGQVQQLPSSISGQSGGSPTAPPPPSVNQAVDHNSP